MDNTVTLALIGLGAAFIGSLPATLTAMAGLRQGRVNEVKTDAVKADVAANTAKTEATDRKVDIIASKADIITDKADALADKTDHIRSQTDGSLSAMRDELKTMSSRFEIATTKISGLEAMVAEKTRVATALEAKTALDSAIHSKEQSRGSDPVSVQVPLSVKVVNTPDDPAHVKDAG